jgi:hypothetical protein
MAVNQEIIAQDIALETVKQVGKFVEALMNLRDLQEWRNESDITDFAYWDSDNTNDATELFGENAASENLMHIDGALMNKILGQVLGPDISVTDSVMHHLENTTVSGGPYNGKTYWEMTQLVRRDV